MPRETEESPQNAEEPGFPGDRGEAARGGAARAPAGSEDEERTTSDSGPAEEGDDGVPMSVDPSALKALAHPLRVRMYDLLSDRGSATASQLAELLGESSGTTSYHLRLLARYGFIEEDADRGNKRDRYWRARSYNLEASKLQEDPEAMATLRMAAGELWRGYARQIETWFRSAEAWGPTWTSASASSIARFHATPEELAELRDELLQTAARLFEPFKGRELAEGERPEGSVRVTLQIHTFPIGTPEENPPKGS